MSQRNVTPQLKELMRDIAESHFKNELVNLDILFEVPMSDPSVTRDYKESAQKRAQDIKGQMTLISELAKWLSGAVDSSGKNTKEEKKLRDDLVKGTREKFKKSGILPADEINHE